MKRYFYIFIILLSGFTAKSSFFDSAKYYLKNFKPQIIGGFSSRKTFIGDSKNKVSDISLGGEFGNKLGLSTGIYWLRSPINKVVTYNAFSPDEYKRREISRFWYLGFLAYYKFYKKEKWTLNIPLRIGVGSASTQIFDVSQSNIYLGRKNSMIIPIESGLNFLYSATWWIGVGGGIGSRIVIGKKTSQKYSGTYYTLGTVFFLSNIYKKIPVEYRTKIEDYKKSIIK
ncbi:MAG: hypothetical protein HUU47_06740 [Bacteroidetes bacterium]|nr:hypothetical protein [Bacteroidota bacterium]